MREILFRGKRTDNGQWVEGYYSKCKDKHYIDYEYNEVLTSFTVTPESVGQFTGLLDKNGNKIFEGDILKCISPNDGSEFISDFIATLSNGITFKNSDLNWDMTLFEYEWMEVEIIGNIHDNPELL